jgi:hypothetical protein
MEIDNILRAVLLAGAVFEMGKSLYYVHKKEDYVRATFHEASAIVLLVLAYH